MQAAVAENEFSWLDVRPSVITGVTQQGGIMRPGEQLGNDRVWYSNGETIWFRRSKSNPATLQRHEKFLKSGNYKHIETQGDVEVYELQESSPFKIKKTLDLGELDLYNVRRQAALAACRRDFQKFYDIMTYMRERINDRHRSPGRSDVTPLADNVYNEQAGAVIESIRQRGGPTFDEINRELHSILQKTRANQSKIISVG